ncbi:MAG: hypothetical protein Q8N99_04155 [Nanoarchaeota archaeon]|nr:hypothetical protein [Nanoarchaeota archaeon]
MKKAQVSWDLITKLIIGILVLLFILIGYYIIQSVISGNLISLRDLFRFGGG